MPKRVSFSPNDVEITEIATGKLISKGIANHHARAYEFSHFVADAKPTSMLTHNEVSRLWHEQFGHINFKYFQQLQKKLHGLRPPDHQGNHGSLQGLCDWKTP